MFLFSLKYFIFYKEKNNIEIINYFFITIILYGIILKFFKNFILDIFFNKENLLKYFFIKNENIITALFSFLFIGLLYFIANKKIGEKNRTFFTMIFFVFTFFYFTKYFSGLYIENNEFVYNFSDFYILGMISVLYLFYEAQNHENIYYKYYEFLIIFSTLPFIINLVLKSIFKMKNINEYFFNNNNLIILKKYIINENFVFILFSISGVILLFKILKDILKKEQKIQGHILIFISILLINIFNTGIFFNENYYIYKIAEIKFNIFLIFFDFWFVFFSYMLLKKRTYMDIDYSKIIKMENKYINCAFVLIFALFLLTQKTFVYSNIIDNKNINNYSRYTNKSYEKIVEYLAKINDEHRCLRFYFNGTKASEKALYYSIKSGNYSIFSAFMENRYMLSNELYNGESLLEAAAFQNEDILFEVLMKSNKKNINEEVILRSVYKNMEKFSIYLIENSAKSINFNYQSVLKINNNYENIDFICAAAYNGNEKMINYFKEKGSKVRKLEDGNDILSYAAKHNDIEFLKKIINDYPFEKKESNVLKSLTKMYMKSDNEDLNEKIEILLQLNVGINEENLISILNSSYPNKNKILNLFFSKNLNINHVNENEENMIIAMLRSEYYNFDILKEIV